MVYLFESYDRPTIILSDLIANSCSGTKLFLFLCGHFPNETILPNSDLLASIDPCSELCIRAILSMCIYSFNCLNCISLSWLVSRRSFTCFLSTSISLIY